MIYNAIEDKSHLFVECPAFQVMQEEAGKDLENGMKRLCKEKGIGEEQIQYLLRKAKYFYKNDTELWPLGFSHYYLGHVPPLEKWTNIKDITMTSQKRFLHGLFSLWHTTNIRLAGRIFGEAQRKATREWEGKKECRWRLMSDKLLDILIDSPESL